MICDLLDDLQELLEKQLSLVVQGRLDAAIELCDQTDQCVGRIVAATPDAEWRERRPHIERLYRDLRLVLTAQRTEVSAALRAVRRGRRALNAYSRTGPSRR